MRVRSWKSWVFATGLALFVAQSVAARPADTKPRIHVVWSGQRLASIAKRYHVSVEALRKANGIARNERIHPGQKLIVPASDDKDGSRAREERDALPVDQGDRVDPGRGRASRAGQEPRVHTVQRGQRLGSIAKRYGVTVGAIRHANGVQAGAVIKPGQKLIIPALQDQDGSQAAKLRSNNLSSLLDPSELKQGIEPGAPSWKSYMKAPARRGHVTLVAYHGTWKGQAVARSGKLLPAALKAIARTLDPLGQHPPADPRLVRLLIQVSDAFGGRPLRIVSGYRGSSYVRDSRHKSGHAVDFSVIDVPNDALRDYLRSVDKVGVGYYPNSSFVHLDARDHSAYWIDYSGPGEPPRYARRSRSPSATSPAPDLTDSEPHTAQSAQAPEGRTIR
jgi:LysM repeat protein